MKNNQNGFGAIGILVAIVALGIIGGAGWYVYSGQQNPSQTRGDSSTTPTSIKSDETTKTQTDEYAGWKAYADSKWKFGYKYPSDWTDSSRDFVNGGKDTREITLKSPNFASDTASVVEDITAGGVITVSASSTDMTDFSATGLKDSENYKEMTVANENGVYYVGRGNAYTYAVIKNKVMYTLSLRTVENDNASEQTYKPIFEKLVGSFEIR